MLSLYLRQAGPPAKVLFGVAASASLLAAGVRLELREAYRFVGRSLIAAGWAALYFTAFGAHSIPAMRVLESPVAGSLALGAVALGMIAHSLRYRVEWLTGGAVFLALATVALSEATTYALVASAALAVVIVLLSRVFRWHDLGLLGVMATYANHAYTVFGKLGPAGAGGLERSFPVAFGFLVFFFVLFAVFELVTPQETDEERLFGVATLGANMIGFAMLSISQTRAVHPGAVAALAGATAVAFIVMAAIERGLTRLPAHRLAGGGALVLAFAAVQLHFSGLAVPVAWTALAQAALLYGLTAREPFFRAAGLLAMVAPAGRLLMYSATVDASARALFPGLEPMVLAGAGLALVFFGDVALYRVAEAHGRIGPAEAAVRRAIAYAGGGLLLFWTAQTLELRYWAAAWVLLSLVWFEVGRAAGLRELRTLALVATPLALLATAVGVLPHDDIRTFGLPGRPLLAGLAITWTFFLDARARAAASCGAVTKAEARTGITATALGCGVMVALISLELRPLLVPLGILLFAGVLLEAGLRARLAHFRWEATVLQVAGVLALAACRWWAELVKTSSGADAIYWVGAWALMMALVERRRAAKRGGLLPPLEAGWLPILSWLAAGVAALGLYDHLPAEALPTALVAGALILRELPPPLRWSEYRLQSIVFALGSAAWVFLVSLTATGGVGPLSTRLLGALPCAAGLYYLSWAHHRDGLRERLEEREKWAGDVLTWTAAAVVASFLHFELTAGGDVAAWALFAIALLLACWKTGLRSFRLQAHALVLLAFGRGVAVAPALQGELLELPRRVVTLGLAALALFACQAVVLGLLGDGRERPSLLSRIAGAHAVLGAALVAVLLFHQVSGKALSIAWTVEGGVLFLAGLFVRQRVHRLLGLGLIVGCIVKVLAYDLRDVETLWRAVSLVVLGVFLVGIALLYARFRDRLRDYL
jgi:hypothetical protein